MIVALSEDGTRVLSRVEYDSRHNSLVGLVSPFDTNGMPVQDYCPASSAQKIINGFKNLRKAEYAIVTMVQPVCDGNINIY